MVNSIRQIQTEYRYNVVNSIFRKNLAAHFGTSMAFILGPVVDGIVTGNYLGVDAVAASSLLRPAFLIFTITGSVFLPAVPEACMWSIWEREKRKKPTARSPLPS